MLTQNQYITLVRQGGFNFILPDLLTRTVNSLLDRGLLTRDGQGYYWITEAGVVAIVEYDDYRDALKASNQ